ncbi:MAG: hypothetical protein ABSA84_05070, partial [Gammaproteobacteria bacterium]
MKNEFNDMTVETFREKALHKPKATCTEEELFNIARDLENNDIDWLQLMLRSGKMTVNLYRAVVENQNSPITQLTPQEVVQIIRICRATHDIIIKLLDKVDWHGDYGDALNGVKRAIKDQNVHDLIITKEVEWRKKGELAVAVESEEAVARTAHNALQEELAARPTVEAHNALQEELAARPTVEAHNALQEELVARPTIEAHNALREELAARPTVAAHNALQEELAARPTVEAHNALQEELAARPTVAAHNA